MNNKSNEYKVEMNIIVQVGTDNEIGKEENDKNQRGCLSNYGKLCIKYVTFQQEKNVKCERM